MSNRKQFCIGHSSGYPRRKKKKKEKQTATVVFSTEVEYTAKIYNEKNLPIYPYVKLTTIKNTSGRLKVMT